MVLDYNFTLNPIIFIGLEGVYLRNRYRIADAGYWMLDTGCWMLSYSRFQRERQVDMELVSSP